MNKAALLLMIPLVGLNAQTSFEVASIKPNRSGEGMSSMRFSADLVTMENVSLQKLILAAYGIPDDQACRLAGPDWLGNEHFDVQARFPAETPVVQVRLMMQSLLQDRFKLALHRETRQLTAYALVIAKSGFKLHAAEDGPPVTSGGPGRLEATRVGMPKLANLLAQLTAKPVTDASDLRGVFDFTLTWSPLDAAAGENAGGDGGPSLFTALEEQLGLKLDARKSPVEVLVVDHMEKAPTEN